MGFFSYIVKVIDLYKDGISFEAFGERLYHF